MIGYTRESIKMLWQACHCGQSNNTFELGTSSTQLFNGFSLSRDRRKFKRYFMGIIYLTFWSRNFTFTF